MTIAAANCLPELGLRRALSPEELRRLEEPACIFEGEYIDGDGFRIFVYTVAGWLDGANVATIQGGCTVGGDAMLIEALDRQQADDIACRGLADTIDALNSEEADTLDRLAAKARLQAVNALRRHDLATKPDAEKSDEFEADMAAIRPLVGDDIILTTTRH